MQAGHAIPGRTGMVLFDEEIIRPQCVRCNIWGRGMLHIFAPKLIQERNHSADGMGPEWWERKLLASRQVRKWSRTELEELIQSYRERLTQS